MCVRGRSVGCQCVCQGVECNVSVYVSGGQCVCQGAECKASMCVSEGGV